MRNVNLRMSAILLVVAVPQRLRPLALKALLNHAIGNDVTAGYVIVRTEDLQRGGPDGLRQADRAVRSSEATPPVLMCLLALALRPYDPGQADHR